MSRIEESEVIALRRALVDLAQRSIGKVFVKSAVDLGVLQRIAERLEPKLWSDSDEKRKGEAIKETIRRAAASISKPKQFGVDIGDAALVLFDLDNNRNGTLWERANLEVVREAPYERTIRYLRLLTGLTEDSSTSTFERFTKAVRTELARALLEIELVEVEKHAVPARDEMYQAVSRPTVYVRRPELERQFHELVDSGARLIAFVGQAGMGKTTLARMLTADPNAPTTPVIHVDGGQISQIDLRVALMQFGVAHDGLNERNLLGYLATLVATPVNGPKYVVLDNLQSTDELAAFIPFHTTSIVVATCRIRGDATPVKCAVIDVRAMTESEASALVKLNIATLGNEEAQEVAERLGCYPLAIRHVCDLVLTEDIALDELSAALGANPSDLRTQQGESLRLVLERVVAGLAERSEAAMAALGFISFGGHGDRDWDTIRIFMAGRFDLDRRSSVLVCSQAIRVLRDYGLVEVSKVTLESGASASRIRIHDLIRVMLERMLVDQLPSLARAMANALVMLDNYLGEGTPVAHVGFRVNVMLFLGSFSFMDVEIPTYPHPKLGLSGDVRSAYVRARVQLASQLALSDFARLAESSATATDALMKVRSQYLARYTSTGQDGSGNGFSIIKEAESKWFTAKDLDAAPLGITEWNLDESVPYPDRELAKASPEERPYWESLFCVSRDPQSCAPQIYTYLGEFPRRKCGHPTCGFSYGGVSPPRDVSS